MKTGQVYKIISQCDPEDEIVKGAFVHRNNDDTVYGFVYDVEGNVITVVLFGPTDTLPDKAIITHESISDDQVECMLKEVWKTNDMIYNHWRKLIAQTLQEGP